MRPHVPLLLVCLLLGTPRVSGATCVLEAECVAPYFTRSAGACDGGLVSCSPVPPSCGAESEGPWSLAIVQRPSAAEQPHFVLGSGTLVHPGALLTAAHVLINLEREDVLVVLPGGLEVDVAGIVRHPRFQPLTLAHDLALLVLSEWHLDMPAPCLPHPSSSLQPGPCQLARRFAENSSHEEVPPTDFPTSNIPTSTLTPMTVVPSGTCESALAARGGSWVHLPSGTCCATGYNHPQQRPYKGDGGAPLLCQAADSGRLTLVGVASWSLAQGGAPTVFSAVAAHRAWLDQVLARLHDGFAPHFKI